jgi:hypothetical protein
MGFEEGRLRERGQTKARNMGKRIWTNREPSSRYREGSWIGSEVIEELDHFRARGHHVLVESLFHSLRS